MTPGFEGNCTMTFCQNRNVSQANDSFAVLEESEMPLEEIFKLAFEVLIAFIGASGNFLVIIVVSKLGKRKTSGDFYLQNLAIADLGTLLLTIPLAAIKEKVPRNWPLGKFSCRYLSPVPEIFYGASVWFIAVTSIMRYRKVVTLQIPGQNKTLKLQRAKRVAAGVWIVSFLIFCLPLYFVVEYRELPNGGKWCGPVWPSWDRKGLLQPMHTYIISLTLVSYILPLAVISFAYFMIFRTIKRSSTFIKAMKREQNATLCDDERRVKNDRLKENKRATKILTPLVVVFAITMLPLNVLRLTLAFWPAIDAKRSLYSNLLYAVKVFVIINSSANPVIYSVASKKFRKGINRLCLKRSRMDPPLTLFGIAIKRRSRAQSCNSDPLPIRTRLQSRPRSRSRSCTRDTEHQLSLTLCSTTLTACPYALESR